MKDLLMLLLTDPFGLAGEPLKTLLQIVGDDEGEEVADKIEAQITEIEVLVPYTSPGSSTYATAKRYVILP